MPRILPGFAVCCLVAGFSTSSFGVALIDIRLNEGSGTTASNSGTLADGSIIGSNRPDPQFTGAGTGVGGVGDALTFTSEQTGRANFHQSVDITDNTGTNNLSAWTWVTWVKTDGTLDDGINNSNPLAGDRASLFATKTPGSSSAGILIGLNNTSAAGPQFEIELADGTGSGTYFGSFSLFPTADGRTSMFDDAWTMLVVTFDNSKGTNKTTLYVGDEVSSVESLGSISNFDSVTSTGVADVALAGISIGDGLNGFGSRSSFYGEIDNVYFDDTALTLAELETLRQNQIPEPGSLALLGLGGLLVLGRKR